MILLGAIPACLLAPPRPGAGGTDAGSDAGGDASSDAGSGCVCSEAGDQLPGAMVVSGATAELPDRLIRAGTCGARVQLLVFDPTTAGAAFDPRCPTAVFPDLVPDEVAGTFTVRALGSFGAGLAAVVFDGPDAGTTRVVSVDLGTGAVARLATSTVPLAPGPAYVAGVPDDETMVDNRLIYGVNSSVWLADLAAATPAELVSTSVPAVVAAPQLAGTVNRWALTGAVGEYEVALEFPSATPPPPQPPLPDPCGAPGGCTMFGHANEQRPVVPGAIASYAISEGGLLTVTLFGEASQRRSLLDLQLTAGAKVVDVAIATTTDGDTWIAALDNLGVVRAAPLTVTAAMGPSVAVGTFITGTLPAPLPPPARVVLGRFGPALRIYGLSGAPGAAQQVACLQRASIDLVPCAP